MKHKVIPRTSHVSVRFTAREVELAREHAIGHIAVMPALRPEEEGVTIDMTLPAVEELSRNIEAAATRSENEARRHELEALNGKLEAILAWYYEDNSEIGEF